MEPIGKRRSAGVALPPPAARIRPLTCAQCVWYERFVGNSETDPDDALVHQNFMQTEVEWVEHRCWRAPGAFAVRGWSRNPEKVPPYCSEAEAR